MISSPTYLEGLKRVFSPIAENAERRLFFGINYNDLSRVTLVQTMEIGGAEMKLVAHKDIPEGEIHMVQDNQLVGKIINV